MWAPLHVQGSPTRSRVFHSLFSGSFSHTVWFHVTWACFCSVWTRTNNPSMYANQCYNYWDVSHKALRTTMTSTTVCYRIFRRRSTSGKKPWGHCKSTECFSWCLGLVKKNSRGLVLSSTRARRWKGARFVWLIFRQAATWNNFRTVGTCST